MKVYKGLISRLQAGNQIKQEIEIHEQVIKEKQCDKHFMGFSNSDRFSCARVQFFVSAHRGVYGNSSCHSIPIVKNDSEFYTVFLKVLNRHFKELMFETADEIIKQAKEEKQGAIEELKQALELLDTFEVEKEEELK